MGDDFNYTTSTTFTGHLLGYCTSNAITTVDRQFIQGILEAHSGVPLNGI